MNGSDSILNNNYTDEAQKQVKETNCENLTISGILFWIEEEWKKIELHKIEWDLERAELQAQISLLQGERKGQESIKRDMILRIKMLEHALREERKITNNLKSKLDIAKSQGFDTDSVVNPENIQETKGQAVNGQNENTNAQPLDVFQRIEKEEKRSQISNIQWKESARRLRRYLTEIGYNDTIMDLRQLRLRQLGYLPSVDNFKSERAHKEYTNRSNNENIPETEEAVLHNFDFLNEEDPDHSQENFVSYPQNHSNVKENNVLKINDPNLFNDPTKSITRSFKKNENIKNFVASLQSDVPLDNIQLENSLQGRLFFDQDPAILGDLAHVQVANDIDSINPNIDINGYSSNLINVSEDEVFSGLDSAVKFGHYYQDGGVRHGLIKWQMKANLQGHLDVIRSLSVHWDSKRSCILSGGDDCLAILWNLDSHSQTQWDNESSADNVASLNNLSSSDVMPDQCAPVKFLRASPSPILSTLLVSLSPDHTLGVVGCLDGGVRVWTFPNYVWNPVEDISASCLPFVTMEHSDSVWSLAFDQNLPLEISSNTMNSKNFVVSASSDRSVIVWSVSDSCNSNYNEEAVDDAKFNYSRFQLVAHKKIILSSLKTVSQNAVSTSVALISQTRFCFNCLIVATDESDLIFINIDNISSEPVIPLHHEKLNISNSDFENSKLAGRIFHIACHSTQSELIGIACDSGYVILYDARAFNILHSIVAHEQTVTHLAFDPTGLYFATTSQDQSLRVWDLSRNFCVQEMHAHRNKFSESSTCVAFCNKKSLMFSAGADSVINVYMLESNSD